MLMYQKICLWTVAVAIIAFLLSKHVLQDAILNLLSSLIAVMIGSIMGIVLFVLFLNFLEKKNYYSAHLLTFEDFVLYFNISLHDNDQNSAQLNLSLCSKAKVLVLKLYKAIKLTALKIVFRLVNSPMIRYHIGNPVVSESTSGSPTQSVYELIRPYGQTPDEMLSSAYGPTAFVHSSQTICVSKKIDEIMHKVFEYTYRDYVETW